MRLDKVTGHVYVSTSNASTSPRYCRRRTRRRGSRFSYYFCGYVYDYNGGLFRTNKAVLSSSTVGAVVFRLHRVKETALQ